MKKYNIAWIIVDSVRNYHTSDDRSKLNIMDKFSNSCVEFKNVITSAPSTLMSISAMMTSVPAYFIGRNYTDFRFDNSFFNTLASLLKKNGWVSRALLMHPDIREKLTVFDLVDKNFWPKKFSHKDWWSNQKIFELLENTLKLDGKANEDRPVFWFLDFNCRKDPKTSEIVEKSINLLNQYNYNENNTIFILCSDHGYPDPNTGITPELLIKEKMTHDMFMTDDNIMIPLILSYPGCPVGLKIDNLCSSLDLMPTIIDLLNVKLEPEITKKWYGKSLVNLINKDKNSIKFYQNRKLRTDARFLGQKDRVTAIRSDKYKLVIYHDLKKNELFQIDIKNRKEKRISVTENQIVFDDLLNEFNYFENKALNLQIELTINQIKNKLTKIKNPKHILIISDQNSSLNEVLFIALTKIFKNTNIEINKTSNDPKNFDSKKQTDLIFVLAEELNLKTKNYIKDINYNKIFYIDLNMNVSIKSGMIMRFIRTLYHNRKFYIQEPTLLFWKILRTIKGIWKKIK